MTAVSISEMIAQMRSAGASIEVIEVAVRALEANILNERAKVEAEREKDAERRAKQAARTRKHRERRADGVTVTLPTRDGNGGAAPALDGRPPSPTPQPPTLNPSPTTGSDPVGSAAAAADGQGGDEAGPSEPYDARRDLFDRGLQTVRRMTGRSEPTARSLLAHWLWLARDEAVTVVAKIDEAAERDLADPAMWIARQLKLRRAQEAQDSTPRQVSGKPPTGRAKRQRELAQQIEEEMRNAAGTDDNIVFLEDHHEGSRGEDRGVAWSSGTASGPSDALLRAAGYGGNDHRAAAANRRSKAS